MTFERHCEIMLGILRRLSDRDYQRVPDAG